MTGYVVRSVRTTATGLVDVCVVTDQLDVVNVCMPKKLTTAAGMDAIVQWCLDSRPRPPAGG